MKIDTIMMGGLAEAGEHAKTAERFGYDGLYTAEVAHDPFFPLVVAAEHTERIELGTSIAVAFARNPMQVAYVANDLQSYSGGRFILGLGSQIRPHIQRRFSMPWSSPAPRMREFISAMREIWTSWHEGTKLSFEGDFYTHTLMTPFFNPGPNPHGAPKVFLAAVGEIMTQVAGEVADGMLVHAFTTPRYLREVTVPNIEKGLAKAGRSRDDFTLAYPGFIIAGRDDDEIEAAKGMVRTQVAFYGSTPAYRPVLELHGWGDLQGELNKLSKQGEWGTMGELIGDEILNEFAVIGEPQSVAGQIRERYGDVVDRITVPIPPDASDDHPLRGVIAELR